MIDVDTDCDTLIYTRHKPLAPRHSQWSQIRFLSGLRVYNVTLIEEGRYRKYFVMYSALWNMTDEVSWPWPKNHFDKLKVRRENVYLSTTEPSFQAKGVWSATLLKKMIPYVEQNQHICILSSFDDQKMTITEIGYHIMVIIIGIIIDYTTVDSSTDEILFSCFYLLRSLDEDQFTCNRSC